MSTKPPTWPPPPPPAAVTNNNPYQAYYPSIPLDQPGIPVYSQSQDNLKWSTGLCHCFDDPAIYMFDHMYLSLHHIRADCRHSEPASFAVSGALYGFLVWFTGFVCLYSCFYRSRMRARFGLEDAP